MIEALLVVILILLLALIFLSLRKRGIKPEDFEKSLRQTWMTTGIDLKIGAVQEYAKEIRDSYKSFEQMLRVPTERASFGEITLETILADQLPPEMYGIRERVLDGKIPDAHIKSSAGIICVDSKFPLDNYAGMLESGRQQDQDSSRKDFFKDVSGHLNKIAEDYVCPDKGSAPFAFAYIPSEAVYYYLLTEAYEMLKKYTYLGVQAVSPLTLSHKIELIRAGVHAKKLSENAEKVRNELLGLSRRFEEIDKVWQVFYRTHFKNLEGKAEELDAAYRRLRQEFEKVERLGVEE
jgi:DNA recombination protein RmuC